MIWTLHNENRNRYCNTVDIYKDSLIQIKKRARSSVTFIIIMLIFWRTNSWAASVNHLNMHFISAPLSTIILILRFSISMFTIEQTTTYIRRKKITRITIFFKCTDSVKLNLIESTCTFFISSDCAMIFFFKLFLFLYRWCCETFVWTIWKKYQAIREDNFRSICSISVW